SGLARDASRGDRTALHALHDLLLELDVCPDEAHAVREDATARLESLDRRLSGAVDRRSAGAMRRFAAQVIEHRALQVLPGADAHPSGWAGVRQAARRKLARPHRPREEEGGEGVS